LLIAHLVVALERVAAASHVVVCIAFIPLVSMNAPGSGA